jgi:hypothetical protein
MHSTPARLSVANPVPNVLSIFVHWFIRTECAGAGPRGSGRSVVAQRRSSMERARIATTDDSSNSGRPSPRGVHAALCSTKMWRSGRRPGSSSRSPAGISHEGPSGSGSGTSEPQKRQNGRRYPGGRSRTGSSKTLTCSRPRTQRRSSARAQTAARNAEPEDFRQRLQ